MGLSTFILSLTFSVCSCHEKVTFDLLIDLTFDRKNYLKCETELINSSDKMGKPLAPNNTVSKQELLLNFPDAKLEHKSPKAIFKNNPRVDTESHLSSFCPGQMTKSGTSVSPPPRDLNQYPDKIIKPDLFSPGFHL